MKIYKRRFYVVATHPGISGFQDFDRLEYRIITGHKAQSNRSSVLGELLPIGEDWYRLEDGHLPDYQLRKRTPEALRWLLQNPYNSIVRLDPATRTIDAKPYYEEGR